MKRPNEMTKEELQHEIAKLTGYKLCTPNECYQSDPIPWTLDTIAAAMPEGWTFEVSKSNWWTDVSGGDNHVNKVAYQASAIRMSKNYHDEDGECIVTNCCDTEILARARLVVACLRAGKERAK